MNWQYTPYIIPIIISVVISGGLAIWGWLRRPALDTTLFIALMLSAFQWALFYGLEILSTNFATIIFWAKIKALAR